MGRKVSGYAFGFTYAVRHIRAECCVTTVKIGRFGMEMNPPAIGDSMEERRTDSGDKLWPSRSPI
jgi:hypothetical protein